MKTVAKHDNQWKLQKHETHQVVERNCGGVSAFLMGGWLSFINLIHLRDLASPEPTFELGID